MKARHLRLHASFASPDISPLPANAIHPAAAVAAPLATAAAATSASAAAISSPASSASSATTVNLLATASALSTALSTSRCTRAPYVRYCPPNLRTWRTFEKKSCRGSRFLGILTRCPAHRRQRTLM